MSAACSSDATGGGHIYTALNQSDRDVVVEVITDSRRLFRLPAHTRGHLSESWSRPTDGWLVTVRDEGCQELASLPVRGEAHLTLHVTTAGKPELASYTVFSLEGKNVTLLDPLPPASCN